MAESRSTNKLHGSGFSKRLREKSSLPTIAIVMYGLTRSVTMTHESIRTNVIDQLSKNSIEYRIFLHRVVIVGKYNNERSGEKDVKLNNTEWTLLSPDYFSSTNHDAYVSEESEYTRSILSYGDGLTNGGLDTRNTLEALHSLREAAGLARNTGIKFDGMMIMRPDLLYHQPVNITQLSYAVQNNMVMFPAWQLHGGFNDRFAFGGWTAVHSVAMRYDLMLQYCTTTQKPLHPESFLKWIVEKYDNQSFSGFQPTISGVCLTMTTASRVRANGEVVKENFNVSRDVFRAYQAC